MPRKKRRPAGAAVFALQFDPAEIQRLSDSYGFKTIPMLGTREKESRRRRLPLFPTCPHVVMR
jgi:hypothetical protein